MSDIKALLEERNQIQADTLAHKIPKRVFVHPLFTLEACCSHAGVGLMEAHYDPAVREAAFESVCRDFYSDVCPASDIRFPASYQILGARNWVLSSSGAVQHPEIEVMYPEDYDDFIAAPYKTIVETILPRVCTALNASPAKAALTLTEAYDAYAKARNVSYGLKGKLSAKYGYAFGYVGGVAKVEAPFDFLADQLRGFKAINMDVRRMPDKVKAAVEAIVPLMVKLGQPSRYMPGALNYFTLHLAPYISRKVFDELFWPTLLDTIEQLDRAGFASCLYAEEDFTRYADALATLPTSTIAHFETGDYREIKRTFGKEHVMGGFYDPTITLTKSTEECIDEAKRLCGACMEGGNFFFTFDRSVMDEASIDSKKLAAVLDWVHEKAVY